MQNHNEKSYLDSHFALLQDHVKIILFTSDRGCPLCPPAAALVQEFRSRSAKIAVESYDITMDRDKSEQYGVKRAPCIVVQGRNMRLFKIYGLPEHVFLDVLIDGIAGISCGRVWFPREVSAPLRMLSSTVSIQVFVENSCSRCKPVAETAIGLALESDYIITDIVIGAQFPALMKKYGIDELPKTVFGENLHLDGHVSESAFLEMIFKAEGLKPGLGKRCLVCGSESPDTICAACKTRIQAEAVDHKLRSEKTGKSGPRQA